MSKIKMALIGAGIVLVERLGDELIAALNDGLLTPVIKAVIQALGG